jgi:hypothetical protein
MSQTTFTGRKIPITRNRKPLVLIKRGIPVCIGRFQLEGWRAKEPWYIFECAIHGLVTNYKWGYDQRLVCPKCHEESSNWRGRASRSSEEDLSDAFTDHSEDKEALPE